MPGIHFIRATCRIAKDAESVVELLLTALILGSAGAKGLNPGLTHCKSRTSDRELRNETLPMISFFWKNNFLPSTLLID